MGKTDDGMEWLATTRVDEESPIRDVFLCPADFFEELPKKVKPSTSYFSLFIAIDARPLDDHTVLQVAESLLSKGLTCLCAWGPDCKRLHDLFDFAAREINDELSGDDVIMTSWHPDETLEDALWFFVTASFVTAKFKNSCKDWIIAPTASPEWEQPIRKKVKEIRKESRRYL